MNYNFSFRGTSRAMNMEAKLSLPSESIKRLSLTSVALGQNHCAYKTVNLRTAESDPSLHLGRLMMVSRENNDRNGNEFGWPEWL